MREVPQGQRRDAAVAELGDARRTAQRRHPELDPVGCRAGGRLGVRPVIAGQPVIRVELLIGG